MAATSCSATARWAGFAPRCEYRCKRFISPSPRLRGEGRGDGDSPQIPDSRIVPLTRRYAPTSPRKRGEVFRKLLRHLVGYQTLELFHVLDVQLEPAGPHDVAGLLITFAGAQPLCLD